MENLIELEECPCCRGAGIITHEGGWSVQVECADCGSHTVFVEYASDAENFIYKDGAQYNYGYKEGYFDSIIAKIESVDKTAFADLVANIRKAEALANDALAELDNKNYTVEYKYVEKFGKEDYVYTLNKGEELQARMNEVYSEFSTWLGSWEM